MGATGYTLPQIAALTFPQFALLLEGIGPILWPRLKPTLDANWGNVGADEARKIIKRHAELQRGVEPALSPDERARQEAWKIVHAYYTGELEDAPQKKAGGQPIPGLPGETARAVIAFASAGGFPSDIWASHVAPLWLDLEATANGDGGGTGVG